jgi:hypothetical protein
VAYNKETRDTIKAIRDALYDVAQQIDDIENKVRASKEDCSGEHVTMECLRRRYRLLQEELSCVYNAYGLG